MGAKNSAGKYRGRVQIGVDKDGKPINKYVCASTMRELEEKKSEIRHHYISGEPIRDDLLLYQYAEEWYKVNKEPFISDASRSAYRSMLTKHILPAFGLRHLRAIRATELQTFVNTFAGFSKSQITIVIGILKGIMKGAYADGIIERDPSVSLIRPKAKKKESRRALTPKENENVLVTIDRHPDGLLLAVLYYCGLRRGEALGLRWEDFDFENNTIHIQRDIDFIGSISHDGALKTEAANRFVPIPDELRAMLLPVRAMPGTYVFHNADGKPLSQSSFKRKWLSLMEDCYCVQDREVDENTDRPSDIRKRLKPTLTPHYFRHNYITMLYEGGIDPLVAMKIVGHTDYQTTANIYTHLSEETMRRASVDLGDVFKAKAKGKPPKGSKQARSRKPPVDTSLPWVNKF